MLGMNAGLSALRTSQAAIDMIAGNIANANTPGYHRQILHQVETAPVFDGRFWRGTGVDIAGINQIASRAIENALTRNISNSSRVQQSLDVATQAENRLAPPDGSLGQRIGALFAELQQLQGQPDSRQQRRIVVNSAQLMSRELNSVSSGLVELGNSVREEIDGQVATLNSKLAELAKLNQNISRAQALGQQPNGLLDNHQQLVNEVAGYIDIEARPLDRGFTYSFSGGHVSLTRTALAIAVEHNSDGTVTFRTSEGQLPLEPTGGLLASHQQTLNALLPDYAQRIDQFASAFIEALDHLQSTGVNGQGPFENLQAGRIPDRLDDVISGSGLPFETRDGQLFVSVYDLQSGQRTLHRIDVSPDTQTLDELAKAISGIPHVQAVLGPVTRQFSLVAEPGYGFDFSGQLPGGPDRSGVTGDAEISFSGVYSGSSNQTTGFRMEGTGQIGVTEGLTLLRLNEGGDIVARYNVGQGYEPGSPLDSGDGISVSFGSGQMVDGDSFSVEAVADSDTSNILVALGLNSFFEGTRANDIRVSREIADNPERICAGRSAAVADGSNVKRMLELRERPLIGQNTTLEGYLDETTASIATEVHGLTALQSELSVMDNSLKREREAISGVDPNEEMVAMLQYQRSFQAAVRVITTIDETLVELMDIVR